MANPMTIRPGSPDAIAAGCTCPVIDNRHGNGVFWAGKLVWWVTEGCPLHGMGKGYARLTSDGG